ncbi:MAG: hypothetical protein M3143_08095 [Actinomycetota bacterium]|nr:hypothetical protein [Actinomycetota bacterium]
MRLPAHRCRRVHIAVVAIAVLAAVAVVTFPAIARAAAQQGGAATGAEAGDTTWFAGLTPDWDDTNVRSGADGLSLSGDLPAPASTRTGPPQGMLLTPAHRLAEPRNQVVAEFVADQPAGSTVAVDVRGTRENGSWTEWVPTSTKEPAVLDAAVTAVQTRVLLRGGDGGASPRVRSVRLSAHTVAQTLAALPLSAGSYRVFATREGLVGGTTANGHVIRERDHFVALPSRRALAPRGLGDYTVKVCSDRGRCEWAPVWDVGPWNTTDDYWNLPHARQSWGDLPQGQPQAQAAYRDGHNGGRDQFGRHVLNPAGIDLADGTFWDGLGLRDNSWVTVTYLWADGGPLGIVRMPLLHVRSGPGTHHPPVGLAAQRATLRVECAVVGQAVTGTYGVTDRWLRIGPQQYVSAAHVALHGTSGSCTTP